MSSTTKNLTWDLSEYKIDIGGPSGNVFVMMAKIANAIHYYYTAEDSIKFKKLVMGGGLEKVGFHWEYVDVLEQCIELTGIRFVSNHTLVGIDDSLYTLESSNLL